MCSIKTVAGTVAWRKACLHEFRHVFDLTLPVEKRQMDVVPQLVYDVLSGLGLADHPDPLFPKLIHFGPNVIEFISEPGLLVFSMEADYGL